jgi:exopolysaccharide biosynthesis polyprenyl glycosylphosphotransferase
MSPGTTGVARGRADTRASWGTTYAPPAQLPGRVQTRLQQRRPFAIRRHASRTMRRVVVLVLGDLFAVATTCLALASIAAALRLLPHPSPIPWGIDVVLSIKPHVVALATGLALLTTGNYHRKSSDQGAFNLMKGSALLALLLTWDVISVRGVLATLGVFLVTFAVAWSLFAWVRQMMRDFSMVMSSPDRWTVPAVLVGARTWGKVPGEDAIPVPDRDYRVIGHVSTIARAGDGALGTIADLGSIIDRYNVEAVIVPTQLSDTELAHVYDVCETAGCECLYSLRSVQLAGGETRLVWRGDEPFFDLGTPALKAPQLMWKRCVDLVVASALLLLVSPLLLIIAIAIKVDSRGPVFFSQNRAGLGGKRFRMLKFRTMRVGADAEKAQLAHLNHTGDSRLFKIPNDPRITRLGRLLRRWSLDELPQIWNVVRGDMSVVGPRPFFETDLEDYESHHFRRLGAKPGITGLWQVSGRSSVLDFEEVVRLDRQYIEQWSFWLDFRILLQTVPTVLKKSGAF